MIKYFSLISLLILSLVSCTNELENFFTGGEVTTINVSAEVFQSATRTSIDNTNYSVKWSNGDIIGIFPMIDESSQIAFKIKMDAGSNNTSFDGNGWGLKNGTNYAAYYPLKDKATLDKSNIALDYTGQVQTGNGNTDHLGAYDFMYAESTSPIKGAINFSFRHLGALLHFKVNVPFTGVYTSLTLKTDGEIPVQTRLNLSDQEVVAESTSQEITLELKDLTIDSVDEPLDAYLFIPSVNLSNKKLSATITNTTGPDCVLNLTSMNFLDGHVYNLTGTGDLETLTIEGDATISKNGADFETDFIALDNEKLKTFKNITNAWSADQDTPETFKILFFNEDKKTVSSIDQAAYAKLFIANENAYKFEDDGTFAMSEVLSEPSEYGANQLLVKAIITKKMPTTGPIGYSARVMQIINGTWTVYLSRLDSSNREFYTISNTTPAYEVAGHKYLEHAFNGLTDYVDYFEGYIFTFENSQYNNNTKSYTDAKIVEGGNYSLTVDNQLIDNTTKHATTVSYNYGLISSKQLPWIVDIDRFNTVYACWHDAQSVWYWKDITGDSTIPASNKAIYGREYTVNLKTIVSTNAYSTLMFGGNLSSLFTNNYIKFENAKITTNKNGIEEYFTFKSNTNELITFTPKTNGAVKPTSDVQSTLKITFSDMFGHQILLELPIQIKIDEGDGTGTGTINPGNEHEG